MKLKNSPDVLFCGLVRKPDLFKKSIKDMADLRKAGIVNNILFSTWKGEVEKSPEIDSFLKENKVAVIKTEEPKDRGYGSIWCQMKALEVGLNVDIPVDYATRKREWIDRDFPTKGSPIKGNLCNIESGRFVLKTRSDVYISSDFLRKIFTSPELFKIRKNLPKGNIFKNKVWVHWYEITRPFYMADECFYGCREDLRKLVNYETSYDTDYSIGPGISHIRRYIHLFLRDYPILYNSLGKYSQGSPLKSWAIKFSKKYFDLKKITFLRKLNEGKRFRSLRKRLEDDGYIDCLAAYYSILFSHFYIDGDSYPNQVVFNEFSTPSLKLNSKDIDIPVDYATRKREWIDRDFPTKGSPIKRNLCIENNFARNKARHDYGGQIHDYNMELLNNICEKKLLKTPLSVRLINAIDKFNNQKSA